MQLVHYAGGRIVTGTAIAESIVKYAEALGSAGVAATVDVPARREDGGVERVRLLIGPASQLLLEPVPEGGEELLDERLVRFIADRSDELNAYTSRTRGGPLDDDSVGDLDWIDEV